jgi:hypothetical protein
MEATYRLKPYELTDGFFKMVKEAFYDKEITITIEEPFDETAYLLRSEANRKMLLAGVEAVKQRKTVHTMTLEEAEALAQ